MGLNSRFTLGIYGDGQLAILLAQEAVSLGMGLVFFTLNSDQSPCAKLGLMIEAQGWNDVNAFEHFLKLVDTVVLENEFIPPHFLKLAQDKNIPSFPNYSSFNAVSDKYKQVQIAEKIGIKTPHYTLVSHASELEDLRLPLMLKSLTGGYDGYGNFLFDSLDKFSDAEKFIQEKGQVLAQEFVEFDKEIAVLVMNDGMNSFTYPAVETIQENSICHYVITPPQLDKDLLIEIERLALLYIKEINGVGIFGIEFFIQGPDIIFNEIAPRPHNSAHYTIEACHDSQFGSLLRIIQAKPLACPTLKTKAAGMLNLLGTRNSLANFEGDPVFQDHPMGGLHLYQKKMSKIGRKMGHFTLLGENTQEILEQLKHLKRRYQT